MMKWRRPKKVKEKTASSSPDLLGELEAVCSAVLGVYLCAEIAKDRGEIPEALEAAIDRALIVASNADKKHKFKLF